MEQRKPGLCLSQYIGFFDVSWIELARATSMLVALMSTHFQYRAEWQARCMKSILYESLVQS
jgi:hypothetical protein